MKIFYILSFVTVLFATEVNPNQYSGDGPCNAEPPTTVPPGEDLHCGGEETGKISADEAEAATDEVLAEQDADMAGESPQLRDRMKAFAQKWKSKLAQKLKRNES